MFQRLLAKHKKESEALTLSTIKATAIELDTNKLDEEITRLKTLCTFELSNDYHTLQKLIDNIINIHCMMIKTDKREFEHESGLTVVFSRGKITIN
jgi:hypothetical protein